ncbi:MAG: bifunctional aspartate kinase/homoserine dehydrogenase I [Bacteroidetes bacterium]|nr:bifunctional aspartate kinase/homoserine dehydrogenase I [Bacteroidota bacterium]
MKVFKFGGSSIGNTKKIENVIVILSSMKDKNLIVVFSALKGVTDKLISLGHLALQQNIKYKTILVKLEKMHLNIINELNKKNSTIIKKKISKLFLELTEILHGVYLLKELTDRTLDHIMSFGEKFSCLIISETLKNRNIDNDYVEANKLITTDSNFTNANINFDKTNKKIIEYFRSHKKSQIVTGFIAENEKGEITTLGRGGSDYTASILGAALNVEEIQIWTDVNGILTADPKKVKQAYTLPKITYEEAMELSHFGAKVIHPPTLLPALKKKIKIIIKNSFDPKKLGTEIISRTNDNSCQIKGISSIDNISVINVQGGGMVGVTGIASRLFGVLADKNINIILITQASSEHSICFAVLPEQANNAKQLIEKEFRLEIIDEKINNVTVSSNFSIIAVVGENMKKTPGISGKVFQSLGKNGINIHAIAQGSSELNISLVIEKKYLRKSLNVLHDALFLSKQKTINLFLIGPGLVGSELLNLISKQKNYIQNEFKINIKLIGLANSKKMIFIENGIFIKNSKNKLFQSNKKFKANEFIDRMKELNKSNSIFIDCTPSDYIPSFYKSILASSISIVTPNKIANSGKYQTYLDLKNISKQHNVQFLYGANVGAALPIINTIQDIITNGDKITKIEGVLSGSISYIFNSLKKGKSFSESVLSAKKKGYTEPDPRVDLRGTDIARKLLILIREAGIKFEMNQIKIENLLTEDLEKIKDIDIFLDNLKKLDNKFLKKIEQAKKMNQVLCYIAKYENGKASVKIETLNANHSFYNIAETDNIIALKTKTYSKEPLVIKGPGAGPDFTASGILIDILRTSNYLV